MRARFRAARAVTCIALASALCVPAFAAQFDYYLKLPPIEGDSGKAAAAGDDGKHKGEIEILSWSWGATQHGSAHTGGGMGAGKANVQDISLTATSAGPASAASSSDRLRTAGPRDDFPAAADGEAEITLKDAAAGGADARKRPGKVKYGDITLKRGGTEGVGGVSVAAGDIDGDGRAIVSPRDAASGLPTGKRQHKPLVLTMGALSLDVPAGMCRAGARYPTAEFGTPQGRHTLENVLVTGCTAVASSGGGRPMETISLNYEKIR